MFRYLYSLFLILAVPLILLRLYLRGSQSPGYRRRIAERFGRLSPSANFDSNKMTLWIHAVSVGETVAAQPFVKQLKATYPEAQLLLTSMTPTGAERVESLFGDSVFHSYLPYDLPTAVNRFLNRVNPTLLIIMETELWPNLLYQCRKRDVKTLLANARLSEKSASGYSKFPGASRTMLQSLTAIAAQTEADAKRLEALGAKGENIFITGSLKFNVEQDIDKAVTDPFFESINKSGRTVVIIASTREGEEEKILGAVSETLNTNPEVLFLLVPRHPERFDEVATLLQGAGLSIQRRTQQQEIIPDVQVILGDSMGEMSAYYSVAAIAFVGGSLVDTGCQNVLEPAAHSLPVLVGPSQFNFAQICNQLEAAGGLKTVTNADKLAAELNELLNNDMRRQEMGRAARSVIDANQQALPALMKVIKDLLS